MTASDPFGLERFVDAQADAFATAMAEIAAGRKRSHWMWFVYPQLAALGRSATARRYGISGLAEARAYLAHPLLGPRMAEAAQCALDAPAPSLRALFGPPDDLKFVSSMTLFERADGAAGPFGAALERWCGGRRDLATLALLGEVSAGGPQGPPPAGGPQPQEPSDDDDRPRHRDRPPPRS